MRRQLRCAQQTRDEVIERQLQKLGFNADDVKYVVYSHFHLDPAGNVKLFPKARHVVQNAELKNAWWPEKSHQGPHPGAPVADAQAAQGRLLDHVGRRGLHGRERKGRGAPRWYGHEPAHYEAHKGQTFE